VTSAPDQCRSIKPGKLSSGSRRLRTTSDIVNRALVGSPAGCRPVVIFHEEPCLPQRASSDRGYCFALGRSGPLPRTREPAHVVQVQVRQHHVSISSGDVRSFSESSRWPRRSAEAVGAAPADEDVPWLRTRTSSRAIPDRPGRRLGRRPLPGSMWGELRRRSELRVPDHRDLTLHLTHRSSLWFKPNHCFTSEGSPWDTAHAWPHCHAAPRPAVKRVLGFRAPRDAPAGRPRVSRRSFPKPPAGS
jgi:hypothetical protein